MEKKEKIKLALKIASVVFIFGVMFFISIPVGITSVVFGSVGFGLGYCSRHLRNQETFFKMLIDKKEDILAGKVVTLVVDTITNEAKVYVEDVSTESKPKKKKK